MGAAAVELEVLEFSSIKCSQVLEGTNVMSGSLTAHLKVLGIENQGKVNRGILIEKSLEF